MAYRVQFSKQAVKELERVNEPYYSAIKKALQNLAINPRPVGFIKLSGRDAYRIRVGNYRIIYEVVDNMLLVDVITIGHRKDVYDT